MSIRKQKRFLSLYEPVHERFERFCRARVYGKMEFRDLMNDTLLIAFQKLSTLKSEQAFLSFLCGISIRLLANHRKKKRPFIPLDNKDIQNVPSQFRSDRDAEIHLLYEALAKLPEAQKESIILFEITGFSIKEIAHLHQVSESAVRQRLVRGRKKLARLLVVEPLAKTKKD